MSLLTHHD